MVCASFSLVGSFSLRRPAECQVLAKPSRAWTSPDVVDTWVIGFWFRIAARTVEPDLGMPERKCSVLFIFLKLN
jgi:hypothetical protein